MIQLAYIKVLADADGNLSPMSEAACLLGPWARISLRASMFVSCFLCGV